MKKELEPFSLRIKCLRKQKRLKQSDIAKFLDCTDRHYQRIEHGEVNISITTLMTLADYFGVTTDYLLNRKEESVMLPERKRYTYADICDTGEDERYELIDGEVYLLSSPLPDHSSISINLSFALGLYLRGKPCRVFHAPADVMLFNEPGDSRNDIHYVVEPDVFVICDRKQKTPHGFFGPPKLVIEILSESTLRHDRVTKFNLYRQAGVAEYWIVDPRNSIVTIFYLEDGVYVQHENYTKDQVLHSVVFPDLSIELAEIFAEW